MSTFEKIWSSEQIDVTKTIPQLSDLLNDIQNRESNLESPEDDRQNFATFFGIDKDRVKKVSLDMASKTYSVTVDLPFTFPKDNTFSEVNVECIIPVKYEVGRQWRIYTPDMSWITFPDSDSKIAFENGKLKFNDLVFDYADLSNPNSNHLNFMKFQYNGFESEKGIIDKISKALTINVDNFPETLWETDQDKLYYHDWKTEEQSISTSNIGNIDFKKSLEQGFVLWQPQKIDEKHYERTITLTDGIETTMKISYIINEKGQLTIDKASLGNGKTLAINGFEFKNCNIIEWADHTIQFQFDDKELQAYQTHLVDFHKAVFDLFRNQTNNSMANDYESFYTEEYFGRNPDRKTTDIESIVNIDANKIKGYYSFEVDNGKYINFSYQNGNLLLKDDYGNPTDTISYNGEAHNYIISIIPNKGEKTWQNEENTLEDTSPDEQDTSKRELAIHTDLGKAPEYQYLSFKLNGEPLNVQGIYQDGKLRLKDETWIISEIPVKYDKKKWYELETPKTTLKSEYFKYLTPTIQNDVPMFSQEDMNNIDEGMFKDHASILTQEECVIVNNRTYKIENNNGEINLVEYVPDSIKNIKNEEQTFYGKAQNIAKVQITQLWADGTTYTPYHTNSWDGIWMKMECSANTPTFHCVMTNGKGTPIDLSFEYNDSLTEFEYKGPQKITLWVSEYTLSYDQENNQIKITPTSGQTKSE